MFDSSGRKRFIGAVTGTLLSTVITSVLAIEERQTYNLIDSYGNPILTRRPGECIKTPRTPNEPDKIFKQCININDRDGDGIADAEDQCPDNTALEIAQGVDTTGAQKGCPKDTDGDTVADYRDHCVNTPASIVEAERQQGVGSCIDATGCTLDQDKDGIPDCFDKCLTTSAGVEVDENGCGKKGDVFTTIIASDVTFGFDKFNLTPQGKAALNEVARNIIRQINYIQGVEVVGHTDSAGSNSYNQVLSKKRAASVAQYLIAQGVPSHKIVQRGEGEDKPIADNSTKVGRAKNRRVEINIIMYEKRP